MGINQNHPKLTENLGGSQRPWQATFFYWYTLKVHILPEGSCFLAASCRPKGDFPSCHGSSQTQRQTQKLLLPKPWWTWRPNQDLYEVVPPVGQLPLVHSEYILTRVHGRYHIYMYICVCVCWWGNSPTSNLLALDCRNVNWWCSDWTRGQPKFPWCRISSSIKNRAVLESWGMPF